MGPIGLALTATAVIAGLLSIVYGARNILRWMKALDSPPIFAASFVDGPRPFTIPADGSYDIWITVPRFKVNALTDRVPEIRAANGGAPLKLNGSLFRTNMMRGSHVTMKVATFSASRGPYVLGLVPAAGAARPAGFIGLVEPLERMLGRAAAWTPWPKADPAQCHLQVRDARRDSPTWIFKGVLPMLLGATLIVGGLVGGALGLAHADSDAVSAQVRSV